MNTKIFALLLSGIFCVLLPVGLLLWWRKKSGAALLPALWGAVTFLLFSQGFEGVLHYFCLVRDHAVSRAIFSHPLLYMLYGSFAAGIFEECGRFVMFRTVLRRDRRRESAVMAGIGHGGAEAILVVGASLILYFVAAVQYHYGGVDAVAAFIGSEDAVQGVLHTLSSYTPWVCLMSILERLSAILIHISLSVYVFISAHEPRKRWYLALAIGLHALFDMPVALFQRGVLQDMWLLELWLLVFAVYLLRSARKRYLEQCPY